VGQKFIENTYRKVNELKALIMERKSKALIEIDGGVNQQNAKPLLDAGADALVAGNFVFSIIEPKRNNSAIKIRLMVNSYSLIVCKTDNY